MIKIQEIDSAWRGRYNQIVATIKHPRRLRNNSALPEPASQSVSSSSPMNMPDQNPNEFVNRKKRTTRETILHTIKQSPQSTVEELAEAADISPVTVRHHLNALLAEGTIEASSVRRKVGRPYYVYSLSEKGQELFPKRYVRLTSRLLDEMKGRLPAAVIDDIFKGVVDNVLEEHQGEFEHLPLEDRLDYLVNLLSEEGFLSAWERTADGYRLVEYSCPYLSITGAHGEVCNFDRQLMRGVLQLDVIQETCMLHGANSCQFNIKIESNIMEPTVPATESN